MESGVYQSRKPVWAQVCYPHCYQAHNPKQTESARWSFLLFSRWSQLSLFLSSLTIKMLHSLCQQIWKTQPWPQDWKRSVFILIPKKGNVKEGSNCCTIALISHASKAMLKILQVKRQQYVNWELPDVQAGFRKGNGTREQIASICWIIRKAREFQENICFCFIDYAKPFDCGDHDKLENSSRDGNTRPPDLPLEKSVCWSRSKS